MPKSIKIYVPFYGLLPFRFNGNWYWGRKLKKTYNSELIPGGCKWTIKTELYKEK